MKRKLNSNAKKKQEAKKLKLNNEPPTRACSSKSSKKSAQLNSELKERCEQLVSSENAPRKSIRLFIKQSLRDEEKIDDKLTFAQKLKNKSRIYPKIFDSSNDNEVPLLHNQKVNSPNKLSKSSEKDKKDKRNASIVLERSPVLDKFASKSLMSKMKKIKLMNNLQVINPKIGNSTMNYNSQSDSLGNYESPSNISSSNQNIQSNIPSTSHDTLFDSSTSHNLQFENYPKSPDFQSDLPSVEYLSEVEDYFQFEDRAPLNMKSESIISLDNENKLQNTDDASTSTLEEFLERHEGIMKTKENVFISNQGESGDFFDQDDNTLELKIESINSINSELSTVRMDVFGNVVIKDETNEEEISIFNEDVTEEEESCEIFSNSLESRQNTTSDNQKNSQLSKEQFILNELHKLKCLVKKQEKQITALEHERNTLRKKSDNGNSQDERISCVKTVAGKVSICREMHSYAEGNDGKMSVTSYVPPSESDEDIPLQDSDLYAYIFKSLPEGNRSDSQNHGTSQSVAEISLPGDDDIYIFKDSSKHNSEELNDEPMAFEVTNDKVISKMKFTNISYQQAKCKKNALVPETKAKTAKCSEKYDTSESEYIPSSDDDEDQHILENDINILKDSLKCDSGTLYDNLNTIPKIETSLEENQIDDEDRCKITIGTSLNTKGKRVYDKSMRCYYCGKYLKDMRKHYLRSHSNEKVVSSIIAHPVNSLARNNLLCKLRNLGNFKHNLDVIKNNKGELIVARRPSKSDSNTFPNFLHYVPCKYCYGFFKKHDFRRHGNTCPFNESASSKNLLSEGIILLHEATSENKLDDLKAVFEHMRKDDVFYSLKNDEIILRLGSLWASKLKGKMEIQEINQKMRELARLLLELNKGKKNCLSLCQYLAPTYFDSIISGVKNITCHSVLSKPKALALKLKNSIKRCCSVKIGMAIRNNDTEMRKQAEDFLTLFNKEYTQRIS